MGCLSRLVLAGVVAFAVITIAGDDGGAAVLIAAAVGLLFGFVGRRVWGGAE